MLTRLPRALGALWMALVACAAPTQEIVVGQVADLSGFGREASRDFIAGAKTWFDHVNASGGVGGRKIKLVTKDDNGLPEQTLALTQELLHKEGAVVLFGYAGDANVDGVVTSAPFRAAGAPMFGSMSGVDVDPKLDNVYFTRASYTDEARKIVDQYRVLGLSRFAVAYVPTGSGAAVAADIRRELQNTGLKLAGEVALATDGKPMGPQAATLRKHVPQVVIILGDSLVTAEFVKAYRPLDASVSLVGLSPVNHTTLLEIAGAKIGAGTVLTRVVPDPARGGYQVIAEHNALMKKYRDEPPSHLTLEGFVAAKALVVALKRAGGSVTRASLAKALREMPPTDVGGLTLAFGRAGSDNRGSRFVEITFVTTKGKLLH